MKRTDEKGRTSRGKQQVIANFPYLGFLLLSACTRIYIMGVSFLACSAVSDGLPYSISSKNGVERVDVCFVVHIHTITQCRCCCFHGFVNVVFGVGWGFGGVNIVYCSLFSCYDLSCHRGSGRTLSWNTRLVSLHWLMWVGRAYRHR